MLVCVHYRDCLNVKTVVSFHPPPAPPTPIVGSLNNLLKHYTHVFMLKTLVLSIVKICLAFVCSTIFYCIAEMLFACTCNFYGILLMDNFVIISTSFVPQCPTPSEITLTLSSLTSWLTAWVSELSGRRTELVLCRARGIT